MKETNNYKVGDKAILVKHEATMGFNEGDEVTITGFMMDVYRIQSEQSTGFCYDRNLEPLGKVEIQDQEPSEYITQNGNLYILVSTNEVQKEPEPKIIKTKTFGLYEDYKLIDAEMKENSIELIAEDQNTRVYKDLKNDRILFEVYR